MMYIESVLQEELSLCMMLRSCRSEPPENAAQVKSTDEYIESLVCPPPPTDGAISEEALGKLIVPSPHWSQDGPGRPSSRAYKTTQLITPSLTNHSLTGAEQIAETLLKTAEEVTSEYCRLPSSATNAQQAHVQRATATQFSTSATPASAAALAADGISYHHPSAGGIGLP